MAKKKIKPDPLISTPEEAREVITRGMRSNTVLEFSTATDGQLVALMAEAPDMVDQVMRLVDIQIATLNHTPDGFDAFYRLVHKIDLPKHGRVWIEDMYKAHEEGVGYLDFAWRGSWKSTTISVTFSAWLIGKEPWGTGLQVNANDDSADKIASAIKEIIENSQAWKDVFPTIKPDPTRGWGAEGYWVIDERYNKEEWIQKRPNIIDPTFVGGGIDSSRLIGKHPTLFLNFDDIHDYKNSESQRERTAIVEKVASTLMPTVIREKKTGKLSTWLHAVGTPWWDDDVYHYLKSTGQYFFRNMPVMTMCNQDDPDAVYIDGENRDGTVYNDIVGWWVLTWPEMFGPKAIISARATSAKREFWRMFMLDIQVGKSQGLKYYTYPHKDIDMNWPMGGGADMATVIRKGVVNDPGRDMFSLCYGAKDPIGHIIVTDGILEQCTQNQAESYIKTPQTIFKNWRTTIIEGDGVGEPLFVSFLMRNPGIRLQMRKTGGRKKLNRQELEMGPWLENATVLISDANTPYLNALRKALDDFPDGNNDIRDGLYWMLYAFPECLVMPKMEEELPAALRRQTKVTNPVYSLGRT